MDRGDTILLVNPLSGSLCGSGQKKGIQLFGRKKPYTQIGIRRLPCTRCGQPAVYQWKICSDGDLWRPLCAECDVLMNEMAMRFVFGSSREEDLKRYREKVLGHSATQEEDGGRLIAQDREEAQG